MMGDDAFRTHRPGPFCYLVALAMPIVEIIAGWKLGWSLGNGDFQMIVAMGFGMLGAAIGAVIGVNFAIAGYFRGELRSRRP